MAEFDYDRFTARNLGLLSEAEQRRLRAAAVFVCGVGGMGGVAVQTLVRAGVGRLALADGDRFELSNLNRQLFATLDTLGADKVAATRAVLRRINPELQIDIVGDWRGRLRELLPRYPIVLNTMDDVLAGVALYRGAREYGATVIDAYTSPLPSVTVVRPGDPRPEERLGWPTVGRDVRALGPADAVRCLAGEIEYVLTHSSSAGAIDLEVAAQVLAGRRARPSFAPVVFIAGTLMALEAIKLAIGRAPISDCRGWFLDPWRGRIEHPRGRVAAAVRRGLVRRVLRRLLDADVA